MQIARRGARPQGYGFVTFATSNDAATAIEQYNGKELAGRTIQIEPLKHTAIDSVRNRQARKSRKQAAKANSTASSNGAAAPPTTEGGEAETAKPKTNKKKSNKKKSNKKKSANEAKQVRFNSTTDEASEPKKSEPSPTLVFVANLAWDVEQAELKSFLEENSNLSVKSLYIARTLVRKPRKVIKAEQEAAQAEAEANPEASVPKPPTGVRRSRGYGFVDFETHEQQQEAIKLFHDKEFHGRNLVLKVALENEERKKNEEIAEAKAKVAEAAATQKTETPGTTTTAEQGATGTTA